MRRCTTILAACLVLASTTAFAGPDPQNAATWYRKAAERLGRLSAEDRQVIEACLDDPGAPPSPQLRIALANAAPLLDAFRRGARQEWSDFGLDPRGADLGPHLTSLRYMLLLSRAEVLVRLHDGDGAAAADRLCSVYRAAEHFGCDRIPISSLHGAAAARMAELTTQFGLDRGAFSAHDAAVMVSALEGLAGRDPFKLVESLAYQQDAEVQWLRDSWNDEDRRQEMIAALSQPLQNVPPSGRVPAETLARLDDDAFADAVGQYDRFMDQVVAAMSLEDRDVARDQLARLDAELAAGAHGVVAKAVNEGASLVEYFDTMRRAEQNIASHAATLKKLAAGELDPREQMNAAVLYARAIELLRRMEPSKIELFAALARGAMIETTPELQEAVRGATPVVDLLREGSMRRRCDFSFLRPDWSWRHFCPAYVAGMADATCLLRADAMCRVRDGDLDAAADRLVISFGIVQHLSGDEPIISSLLAHDVFNRTMELAQQMVKDAGAKDEHREALRRAVGRIGRSDPFGYLGSIETARAAITMRWRGEYKLKGEGPERIAARIGALRAFDGDRLLYLIAYYDALLRTDSVEGADDPAARLGGVLSMPAVQAARREVSEVTALLALGEVDELGKRPIPCLGDVMEHKRSARRDLRQAMTVLTAQGDN